jgi:transposase-like protein
MGNGEFCPRCGSGNVDESDDECQYRHWKCQDCGYCWRIKEDGEAEATEESEEEIEDEEDMCDEEEIFL